MNMLDSDEVALQVSCAVSAMSSANRNRGSANFAELHSFEGISKKTVIYPSLCNLPFQQITEALSVAFLIEENVDGPNISLILEVQSETAIH